MSSEYIYDDKDFKVKRSRRGAKRIILALMTGLVGSVSLAVLYYFVFSLFFSTDVERKLRQENRMYEKIYPEMEKKDRLLADVVVGLQMRDDEIYDEIFQTKAPNMERLMSVNFLASDTLKDDDIASWTADRIAVLRSCTDRVEENFRRIFSLAAEPDFVLPPMTPPVKNFDCTQVGATIGSKISPFYKVKVAHSGLDILVPEGTKVYASGKGVVSNVKRSVRSGGNSVEVTHEGGYVTVYSHLDAIKVGKGRRVTEDSVLGTVGNSGFSFAPHLHYELYRDGKLMDPVNYMFRTLDPYEYADVMIMAVSTGQSMD